MVQQNVDRISFKYVDTSFTFQIVVTCTLPISVANLQHKHGKKIGGLEYVYC